MQILKLLKYLPVTIMAAGIVLATTTPTLFSVNNGDNLNNLVFNTSQQNGNTDYSDQLEYIRNDVTKQTGVTNLIASIKISNDNSSLGDMSAALVTKTDGSTLLYMWGSNELGQLGNGTKDRKVTTPTKVIGLDSKKITQIALGYYHSAVLLEDGSLYMWGNNNNGQLGNETNVDTINPNPIPTLVDATPFGSKKITQIALGGNSSSALLDDGSLYMWGNNNNGQLGNGGKTNTSTPTPVTALSGNKITQITLGITSSGALLEDGSLYMWGNNDRGQLGIGTSGSSTNTSTPTPVTALHGKKVTQIDIGYDHSAALLEDGSLYMWGANNSGQLGFTISSTPSPLPKLVIDLSGKKITQIALGSYYSAALLEDGSLYMWGINERGQLGNSTSGGIGANNSTPTPVDSTPFGSKKITQITLGDKHSTALLEDGSLYAWGSNFMGQLGNETNIGMNAGNPTPRIVILTGDVSDITANPSITAVEAVDNLWVDNKFNLTGFKNSFNLINILDVTDQEITMDTKPTYNNAAGTVTMNIKIKYYYDENGLIVADTAAAPMIIGGFQSGSNIITNITAKTTPLSSIVVDKWLSYVTVDEKINRTKLEEFLTLTDVPADAEFAIINSKPINKTGVLTFNITSSKTIDDQGNVLNDSSNPFPITLNMTPRITKMTPKTSGYPADLTPTALKAKLFDSNGLVKDMDELDKYLTIVTPADGVQYHLVDNKWDANGGDGTVKFAIYASKFYNTEGGETIGGGTIAVSKVDFDLSLQREVSTIAVKATMPTNVRVDNFETYVKSAGTAVATSKLGEFFDLTNIPSDATFSIGNVKIDAFDANLTRNHLTFDLTINQFNQGSPATPATYTHNYELTLGIQHQQTEDNTGLTVGLVIGGVVLVLLLVGLYIWNKKRIQAAGGTPDGKDGKAKDKQSKKEAKAEKSKQAKNLAGTEVKNNDSIKIAETEGSLDQTNIANPAEVSDQPPIELGENKHSAKPTSSETKSDKAAKTSKTKSLSPNKTTNIDKPKSNPQATKKLNASDDHKKSSQQTSTTAKNDKTAKDSNTKSLSPDQTTSENTNIDKQKSNPQATKKFNTSDDHKKSSQRTTTEAKNDKTAGTSNTKSLSPNQTTSKNTNIDKQKSNPQAAEKLNASDEHKPEPVNETKPIDEAKAKDSDKKA